MHSTAQDITNGEAAFPFSQLSSLHCSNLLLILVKSLLKIQGISANRYGMRQHRERRIIALQLVRQDQSKRQRLHEIRVLLLQLKELLHGLLEVALLCQNQRDVVSHIRVRIADPLQIPQPRVLRVICRVRSYQILRPFAKEGNGAGLEEIAHTGEFHRLRNDRFLLAVFQNERRKTEVDARIDPYCMQSSTRFR